MQAKPLSYSLASTRPTCGRGELHAAKLQHILTGAENQFNVMLCSTQLPASALRGGFVDPCHWPGRFLEALSAQGCRL